MRVIRQQAPGDNDNRGIVVSHVGMNTERHWEQFRELDAGDQNLWAGLASAEAAQDSDSHSTSRDSDSDPCLRSFSPQMLVNWEVPEEALASGYGDVTELSPEQIEAGDTDEDIRLAARQIVGPQQRRREARSKLKQYVDDAIRQVRQPKGVMPR